MEHGKKSSNAPELLDETVPNNRTTLSSVTAVEHETNVHISTTLDEIEPQYSQHQNEPNITPSENIVPELDDELEQAQDVEQDSDDEHDNETPTPLAKISLRGNFSKSVPLMPIPMLSPTISIGSLHDNDQQEIMTQLHLDAEKKHRLNKASKHYSKTPQHIVSSTIDQEEEKTNPLIKPKLIKVESEGTPRKIDYLLNLSDKELKKRAKKKQISVDEYSRGRVTSTPVVSTANLSDDAIPTHHRFQFNSAINRQREISVFYAKLKTRANIAYGIAFFVELLGMSYGIYELVLDHTSVLGITFTGVYIGLFIVTLLIKCCCPITNPMSRLDSVSPTNNQNVDINAPAVEMSHSSRSQKQI